MYVQARVHNLPSNQQWSSLKASLATSRIPEDRYMKGSLEPGKRAPTFIIYKLASQTCNIHISLRKSGTQKYIPISPSHFLMYSNSTYNLSIDCWRVPFFDQYTCLLCPFGGTTLTKVPSMKPSTLDRTCIRFHSWGIIFPLLDCH